MKHIIAFSLLVMTLTGCKNGTPQDSMVNDTETTDVILTAEREKIEEIEIAHHKSDFLGREMISFDIDLKFGGQDRLDATVFVSTDSKYVRIEKNNGEVLLYDGTDVWLSPKSASQNGARFDIFTWSYFFSLPYKLSDPGTLINLKNEGTSSEHLRLSFEAGTGDAPDDWYDLYTYPKTDLLQYAGYIVTYGGTPADQAAQNAHAISYENYKQVEGIPLAHSWKFYNYGEGIDTTAVIGTAELSNIRFSKLEPSIFVKPDDAVKIEL